MAITTMRAFVDALEAITITGVTRQGEQGPPTSANTADLPWSFVEFPTRGEGPMVLQNAGGWPALHATHVILVQSAAQDLQPVNFDKAVDFMDELSSAFEDDVSCGELAKSHITWSQRLTSAKLVAGFEYWAVITEVDAQG